MKQYTVKIKGSQVFTTTDRDLYRQVKQDIDLYVSRYGTNGLEDYIQMILEDL